MGSLFGSGSREAARAETEAARMAMSEQRRAVDEAKSEIGPAFDLAQMQRQYRTQQAVDALGGGFAPQMDVIQQGNMNAQQTLAGSGQQMQNAILGQPVNYSGLQPRGINFDAQSFLGGMPDVYSGEAPQMPGADIGVPEQGFGGGNPFASLNYDQFGNKNPDWQRTFNLPSSGGGNIPSKRSAWGTGIYTERK